MTTKVAKGRTSRSELLSRTAVGAVMTAAVAAVSPATAQVAIVGGAPTPGAVTTVLGSDNVSTTITTTGSDSTVALTNARTLLNWDAFDIDATESVTFSFGDRSWIALNRVAAGSAQIIGTLNSFVGTNPGGNVWILARDGVMFGSSARVNVGGLLAGTGVDLGVGGDAAFLGGATVFTFSDLAAANPNRRVEVASGAQIRGYGGVLAFVSREVATGAGAAIGSDPTVAAFNDAARQADTEVLFGAADAYTLTFAGDPGNDFDLLSFVVPAGGGGGNGSTNALDLGAGATAGDVFMAAVVNPARATSAVINVGGTVAATQAASVGGDIVLSGGGGLSRLAADADMRATGSGPGAATAVQVGASMNAASDVRLSATGSLELTGANTLSAGADISLRAADLLGGTLADAQLVEGRDLAIEKTGGGLSLAAELTAARHLSVTAEGGTLTVGADMTALAGDLALAGDVVQLSGVTLAGGGAAVVSGVVTLAGANTLTAAGQARFDGSVDGAGTLSTNGGTVEFAGSVGAGTALGALTTTGQTELNGVVRTVGSQTYNDSVVLGGDAVLTSTSGATVTFSGTVNGANALTVNTAGVTVFAGVVGASAGLAALTTDAAGTTAINGGAVTTTGAQTYGDAVTLGADAVLSATGPSGAIALAGTVDGARALTLNAAGLTRLGGVVGGNTALTSITTDAPGSTSLAGDVRTSGAQSFGDAVTLTADTALTTPGAVTFSGAVNGARALTVNAGGLTTFAGEVGAATALASLSTDAGGSTAVNGGRVATTGTQSYGDALQIGAGETVLSSTTGGISVAGPLTAGEGVLRLQARAGVLNVTGPINVAGDYAVEAQDFTGATLEPVFVTPTVNDDLTIVDTLGGVVISGARTGPGSVSITAENGPLVLNGLITAQRIALATVGGGAMTLNGDLDAAAGSGIVELSSTAGVVQTGGSLKAGGLAVRAAGDVVMDGDNDVAEVAALMTAGGDFSFTADRPDGASGSSLTIGTVGTLSGLTTSGGDVAVTAGTVEIPGARNLIVGAVVNSNGGSVRLRAADDILINAGVSTDSAATPGLDGRLELTAYASDAVGSILQTAPITTSELLVRSSQSVSLADAGNNVGSVAASFLSADQTFALRDGSGGLRIGAFADPDGSGPSVALSGITARSVFLESNGPVTQDDGVISATDLAVRTLTGDVRLTGPNGVSNLAIASAGAAEFRNGNSITVDAVSGFVGFPDATGIAARSVDIQAQGDLTVTSAVSASNGPLRLTTTGAAGDDLALNALVVNATGTVELTSAGGVTQAAGLVAGALRGASGGAVDLTNNGNAVTALGDFVVGAGGFKLTNAAALTVSGNVSAAGQAVTLVTTFGGLSQAADSVITAASLSGSSAGATSLNGRNRVEALAGFNAEGFSFNDADDLQVTAAVEAGGGGLSITSEAGALTTAGGVNTTATLRAGGNIALSAGTDLTVSNDIVRTGSGVGAVGLLAGRHVTLENGADVISGAATAVVVNSDRDGAAGGAVQLNAGVVIDTLGGDLVLGGGADPAATAAKGEGARLAGVELNGAVLRSGAGDISIRGEGASGGAGVVISSGSEVLAAGGDVAIVGAGRGTSPGLVLRGPVGGAGMTGDVLLRSSDGSGMTLDGVISTDPASGSVTFVAAGGGAVVQSGGSIVTGALRLVSDAPANFSLDRPSNDARVLAGEARGEVAFSDANDILVGGVSTATTPGGAPSASAGLNVGGTGVVVLSAGGSGRVTQTASGRVVAGELRAAGDAVDLRNPDNQIARLGASTATGADADDDFRLRTGAAGLEITGPVTAAGNTVELVSGGGLLQSGLGVIAAGTLTGSAGGAVVLGGPNQLSDLGDFTVSSGGFSLTNAATLNLLGDLDAAGQTVELRVLSGGLTQFEADSVIRADVLTGVVDAGAVLDGANLISNLGSFEPGAGRFALRNAQALNVSGALAADGQEVNLNTTAGAISQSDAGVITARLLTGVAAGGALLDGANRVENLGDFTVAAGGFALFNSVRLNLSGDIVAAGQAVDLRVAAGGLSQSEADSVITAGVLAGSVVGGALLDGANRLDNLGDFTAASGGFGLVNAQALNVSGDVAAAGQTVRLTTTAGALSQSEGGGVITAATLTGTAAGGVVLDGANQIANLGDFSTASGGFALTNAGALNLAGDLVATGQTAALTTRSGGLDQAEADSIIRAGVLTGSVAGEAVLDGANEIDVLSGFRAAGFTLLNARGLTLAGSADQRVDGGAGGVRITASGPLAVNLATGTAAGGDVRLTTLAGGAISFGADVDTAGDRGIQLAAAGAVAQGGGRLATGALSGSAVGGVDLDGPNQIVRLGPFVNSGSGDLVLNNARELLLASPVRSAGGVALRSSGALTGAGDLTADAGSVALVGTAINLTGVVDAGLDVSAQATADAVLADARAGDDIRVASVDGTAIVRAATLRNTGADPVSGPTDEADGARTLRLTGRTAVLGADDGVAPTEANVLAAGAGTFTANIDVIAAGGQATVNLASTGGLGLDELRGATDAVARLLGGDLRIRTAEAVTGDLRLSGPAAVQLTDAASGRDMLLTAGDAGRLDIINAPSVGRDYVVRAGDFGGRALEPAFRSTGRDFFVTDAAGDFRFDGLTGPRDIRVNVLAGSMTGVNAVAGRTLTLDARAVALSGTARAGEDVVVRADAGGVSMGAAAAGDDILVSASGDLIVGAAALEAQRAFTDDSSAEDRALSELRLTSISGSAVLGAAEAGAIGDQNDFTATPGEAFRAEIVGAADARVHLNEAAPIDRLEAGLDVAVVATRLPGRSVGGDVSIREIRAGDDIRVEARGGGSTTVDSARTLGRKTAGADGAADILVAGAGVTVRSLVSADGDVVLDSSGDLQAAGVIAADDVSISARNAAVLEGLTVTGQGLDTEQDGRVVTIRGGDVRLGAPVNGTAGALNALTTPDVATVRITAERDVQVSLSGDVRVTSITAGDDVQLSVLNGSLDAGSVASTGSGADGENNGSNIELTARSIQAGEFVRSADDLAVRSTAGDVVLRRAEAGDDLRITSTEGAVAIGSAVLTAGRDREGDGKRVDVRAAGAGGDVRLGAAAGFTATGDGVLSSPSDAAVRLQASRDVSVDLSGATHISEVAAGRNVVVTSSGDLDIGALAAGGDVLAASTQGDAAVAALTLTGAGTSTATVRAGRDAVLGAAAPAAANVLSISSPSRADVSVFAGRDARIGLSGDATLTRVEAGRDASVSATGAVRVTGSATAGDDLRITAATSVEVSGGRTTGQGPDTEAGGDPSAPGVGSDLVIEGGSIDAGAVVLSGTNSAADDVFVVAGRSGLITIGGRLTAADDGVLRSGDLSVTAGGAVGVGDTLSIQSRRGGLTLGGAATADGLALDQGEIGRIGAKSLELYAGASGETARGDLVVGDLTYDTNLIQNLTLLAGPANEVRVPGVVAPAGRGSGSFRIGRTSASDGWTPKAVVVTGSIGRATAVGLVVDEGSARTFDHVDLNAVSDVIVGTSAKFVEAVRAAEPGGIDLSRDQPFAALDPEARNRILIASDRLSIRAGGKIVQQNTAAAPGQFQGVFLDNADRVSSVLTLGGVGGGDAGAAPSVVDLFLSFRDRSGALVSSRLAAANPGVVLDADLRRSNDYRINGCSIGVAGECAPLGDAFQLVDPSQLAEDLILVAEDEEDQDDPTITGAGNEEVWRAPE